MQKEFFGYNSIENLVEILKNYKKIFLVTGKKSYILSGAEKKINSYLTDKNVAVFNEFSPNPNLSELKKAMIFYKKIDPDIVIAIGGGSVIDMGKMVNLLAHNNGEPLDYIKKIKKPDIPGKTLIAIPTTSGTGSESTHFATIYVDKKKYSIADRKFMLPSISIIDPFFTESLPKKITASTGLDAICQGIESLWAVNSTEQSRKFAKESVEIGLKTIEKVVNNPDKKSRLDMAKVAHLSGKAINISKTTACHSISYPITSYFNIPHGHAVALTLGQFIEFNDNVTKINCNDKRGVKFVKDRLSEIVNLMGCNNATDAKSLFQKLMEKIGIEHRLKKLNIDNKGRKLIIDNGYTADRMNNNPRLVTKEDIKNILNEIK